MDLNIISLIESEELKASIIKDTEAKEEESKAVARSIDKNVKDHYRAMGCRTDDEVFTEMQRYVHESFLLVRKNLKNYYEREFGFKIISELTPTQEKKLLEEKVILESRLELAKTEKECHAIKERIRSLENLLRDYGSISYVERDIARLEEELVQRKKELGEYIELLNKRSKFEELDIETEKYNLEALSMKIWRIQHELKTLGYHKEDASNRIRIVRWI